MCQKKGIKQMKSNSIPILFPEQADESQLSFAVIAARHNGKWVFCMHRDRDTWECPGGHRDPGESIEETARRELWEETGADSFSLRPVCAYGVVSDGGAPSFGMLFYAEIFSFGPLPEAFEMKQVECFSTLPGRWTYPEIQPFLLERAFIPSAP